MNLRVRARAGSASSSLLNDAIADAVARGVTVVAGAGNNGSADPAANALAAATNPQVIRVAWIDTESHRLDVELDRRWCLGRRGRVGGAVGAQIPLGAAAGERRRGAGAAVAMTTFCGPRGTAGPGTGGDEDVWMRYRVAVFDVAAWRGGGWPPGGGIGRLG